MADKGYLACKCDMLWPDVLLFFGRGLPSSWAAQDNEVTSRMQASKEASPTLLGSGPKKIKVFWHVIRGIVTVEEQIQPSR